MKKRKSRRIIDCSSPRPTTFLELTAISSFDKIEKLKLQVRFEKPVPINDYKTIRKLLQIANAKENMLIGMFLMHLGLSV